MKNIASSHLPIQRLGEFHLHAFQDSTDSPVHIALVHASRGLNQPTLLRMHSECLTGDVFGSARCDCSAQLNYALEKVASEGGVLLYLRQEGRGIGLVNKIKAYALQDQGYDTVEANHQLGFSADERDYRAAAEILKLLGIYRVRLLTNNPKKLSGLQHHAIDIVERIPLETTPTPNNIHYLKTKYEKLGHCLNLPPKNPQ